MIKLLITALALSITPISLSSAQEIEVFEKDKASGLTFPQGKYQYNSGKAQMTARGKTFVISHRNKADTSAITKINYNIEDKSFKFSLFDTTITMKPIAADSKSWHWNNSLPSIVADDKAIFDELRANLIDDPKKALAISQKITKQMADAQDSKGLSDLDLAILSGVKDLSKRPRWIGSKQHPQGLITIQIVQLTDNIMRGQVVLKGKGGTSRQNFSLVKK